MNPNPASPSVSSAYSLSGDRSFIRRLSWPAIFAGIVAALALQVLFMMLGAGLGFAIYTPLTDENPIANLGAGAIIVQGISAVFSLWFGGWVAGRFAPVAQRSLGWLHGFIVWCAATVAGVLVVSTGAGWALGDLSKVVGGGLSMAGKPAAAAIGGAGDLAKDALKKSDDTVGSFVNEAVSSRRSGANEASAIRAKREIGLAAARLFNPAQADRMDANRSALVATIAANSSLSEAEANRLVGEWTTTYESLKAELADMRDQAEAKARKAADEASTALAIFSLGAFVAFALGAVAASCGGCHGAKVALKHDGYAVDPRTL